MGITFKNRDGQPSQIGNELIRWWEGLADDRGGRANLRRAATPTQVAFVASYQHIFQRIQKIQRTDQNEELSENEYERLAAIVGLLAHVKQNINCPIPETMSNHLPGERPPVSELRFLRLLDSPDIESLFTGLRRVLPLMNHKADVIALANDLYYWGDSVKKRWAYSYRWQESA